MSTTTERPRSASDGVASLTASEPSPLLSPSLPAGMRKMRITEADAFGSSAAHASLDHLNETRCCPSSSSANPSSSSVSSTEPILPEDALSSSSTFLSMSASSHWHNHKADDDAHASPAEISRGSPVITPTAGRRAAVTPLPAFAGLPGSVSGFAGTPGVAVHRPPLHPRMPAVNNSGSLGSAGGSAPSFQVRSGSPPRSMPQQGQLRRHSIHGDAQAARAASVAALTRGTTTQLRTNAQAPVFSAEHWRRPPDSRPPGAEDGPRLSTDSDRAFQPESVSGSSSSRARAQALQRSHSADHDHEL